MRQQIKNWLMNPVLHLYEFAALIALTTKQYALAVLCGVIIPLVAIALDRLKKEKFSNDK